MNFIKSLQLNGLLKRRTLLASCLTVLAACKGGKNEDTPVILPAPTPTPTPTPSPTVLPPNNDSDSTTFDIIIYGSSLGGLASVLRSGNRNKKRICLLEPYPIFGGMHASGLSFVDLPPLANFDINQIIGGDIVRYYFDIIADIDGSEFRYNFSPKTAEFVSKKIINDFTILAFNNIKLNPSDVVVEFVNGKKRIRGLNTPKGFLKAEVFIDASYEGDLMAGAVGSDGYTFGRESVDETNEPNAGVQKAPIEYGLGKSFKFFKGIGTAPDVGFPFLSDPAQQVGSSDQKVQSYNFRMPLTRDIRNRIPFLKPENYEKEKYSTFLQILRNKNKTKFARDYSAADLGFQGNLSNRKIAWNALNFVNGNLLYPDSNWSVRDEIIKNHVDFQQGFMWCIQNDDYCRDFDLALLQNDARDIGLCGDEFTNSPFGSGWPPMLYVREARRLKSIYVMREMDLSPGNSTKTDSIGRWCYNWDFHMIQGFKIANFKDRVALEGIPRIGGTVSDIYQIPMRAIIPRREHCTNLIVPVCSGFTHVSWSVQRLEIPFAICGEAAGEIASWKVDNPNLDVQDVQYDEIRSRLVRYGSRI